MATISAPRIGSITSTARPWPLFIRTVQELLRHCDVGTMIYLHVMNRGALGVKGPLDRL